LRRCLLAVGLVALAACGSSEPEDHETAPATTTGGGALAALEVVDGLDRPVYLTSTPSEPDRLYVVEQTGVIRIVDAGVASEAPFLDVSGDVRTSPKGAFASERGLLSMVFAPDFATSGRFYVDYTDRNGDVNVVEYRAEDGRADRGSARRILHVEKQSERHQGGQLQFGPDGRLYVSIGDDGASQVHPQSLEPGDRLGKILALDVGDPAATWEVVAYGLRNPWRFSFDRVTGDLWVGDVGENSWEEVTHVPAGSGLVNLGWAGFEGHAAVVLDEGGHQEPEGPGELVWPVAVYDHETGCSVIGGYVYRGHQVTPARGRYFYADYCTGVVWSLDPDNPEEVRLELDLPTTLASFGEDAAGELYLVSRTGKIFRLAAG
jgi:glucose/arabinose dehydrogenase